MKCRGSIAVRTSNSVVPMSSAAVIIPMRRRGVVRTQYKNIINAKAFPDDHVESDENSEYYGQQEAAVDLEKRSPGRDRLSRFVLEA